MAIQMASLGENAEPAMKSGKGRQISMLDQACIPDQTIGSHG